MLPNDLTIWVVVLAVAAACAVAIVIATRRRRRKPGGIPVPTLRDRLRESQVLMPVTPGARQRYAEEWTVLQARFVQVPVEALRDAERLVGSIMRDRGYPYLDPQFRPDAVDAAHSAVADDYRNARRIVKRLDDGSRVSLEELRQAIVHYRAVVQALLETKLDDTSIDRQIDQTM